MPIKEIMTLASIIVAGWLLAGGQQGVRRHLRSTQIQILKEVARTDNWGNPSIFVKTSCRRRK